MTLPSLPANGIATSPNTVKSEWIDYNGHLNVAYYTMLFDWGIDAIKAVAGIDLDHIEREQRSTVALESRIAYLSEASLGDALRVDTRIIDFDGKRVHYYQEMFREDELVALSETVSISFDTASRCTCPFENEVAQRYKQLLATQHSLGRPDWVGRGLGIRRK